MLFSWVQKVFKILTLINIFCWLLCGRGSAYILKRNKRVIFYNVILLIIYLVSFLVSVIQFNINCSSLFTKYFFLGTMQKCIFVIESTNRSTSSYVWEEHKVLGNNVKAIDWQPEKLIIEYLWRLIVSSSSVPLYQMENFKRQCMIYKYTSTILGVVMKFANYLIISMIRYW